MFATCVKSQRWTSEYTYSFLPSSYFGAEFAPTQTGYLISFSIAMKRIPPMRRWQSVIFVRNLFIHFGMSTIWKGLVTSLLPSDVGPFLIPIYLSLASEAVTSQPRGDEAFGGISFSDFFFPCIATKLRS